jgi:hypothetical protein
VIETERKFCQVNREKLFVHSAILIEPVFGIAPESFNAINMISALGSAIFFLPSADFHDQ